MTISFCLLYLLPRTRTWMRGQSSQWQQVTPLIQWDSPRPAGYTARQSELLKSRISVSVGFIKQYNYCSLIRAASLWDGGTDKEQWRIRRAAPNVSLCSLRSNIPVLLFRPSWKFAIGKFRKHVFIVLTWATDQFTNKLTKIYSSYCILILFKLIKTLHCSTVAAFFYPFLFFNINLLPKESFKNCHCIR